MGKSQIAVLLLVCLFVLAAGCEMTGGPSNKAQLTASVMSELWQRNKGRVR